MGVNFVLYRGRAQQQLGLNTRWHQKLLPVQGGGAEALSPIPVYDSVNDLTNQTFRDLANLRELT